MAVASYLSGRHALGQNRREAVERYLQFLSSGGSGYALDLLRQAGVDRESAAPYDAAFDSIARQVSLARTLLRER